MGATIGGFNFAADHIPAVKEILSPIRVYILGLFANETGLIRMLPASWIDLKGEPKILKPGADGVIRSKE